jgi:hypothetical protein
MYNGFDWYGCILEVHEVRLTAYCCLDAYHPCLGPSCWIVWTRGFPRQFLWWIVGLLGWFTRFALWRMWWVWAWWVCCQQLQLLRPGLVQDYSGLDQQAGGYARTYDGRYAGEYGGGYDTGGYKSEPSQQIMVHKQCKAWSTTCAQDTLHCEHVHPVRQACLTLSRPPFGQK